MTTVEERLAGLEGRMESRTQLQEIVLGQAKQIDWLETAIDDLVRKKVELREQLNCARG